MAGCGACGKGVDDFFEIPEGRATIPGGSAETFDSLRLSAFDVRRRGELLCAAAHFLIARLCYHKDDCSSRRKMSLFERTGG